MEQDRRIMVEMERGVVDEARRKAPQTLPGLIGGGIIGALLFGPVGAFIGGMIGGAVGLSADLEDERNKLKTRQSKTTIPPSPSPVVRRVMMG